MGSKTRAKFRCTSIAKQEVYGQPGQATYSASFSAVTGGSPENESFWKWTPGGSIQLSTVREDHFKVGVEYYVDFSEALAPVDSKS